MFIHPCLGFPMKCKVESCSNETLATGERLKRVTNPESIDYCRKHVSWLKKYGSVEFHKYAQGSLADRFWRHVDKRGEDECWTWLAYAGANGYGRIWDVGSKRNKLAHRVAFELANGYIEDDLVVMHSCDNPSCVNPKHLHLGTYKLNTFDMIRKGRRKVSKKCGEDNPRSKLSLEQAKFIKAHPELGLKKIADMFGLSPNCIRSVRIGRTWKDA